MKRPDIIFEEALSDDWSGDFEVKEVPLDEKPLVHVGAFVLLLGLVLLGRVLFLGLAQAEFYRDRAEANLGKYERITAPRGIIFDRNGEVLAENKAVFSAVLKVREFFDRPDLKEPTLALIESQLGIPPDAVWKLLAERGVDRSTEPLLLTVELTQGQLVALKEKALDTIAVESGFRREYPGGTAFSSALGYIGLPSSADLAADAALSGRDFIGKTGLEAFYETKLRGDNGLRVKLRDAKGQELSVQERASPKIGEELHLSLDAGLQKYFHERMQSGLAGLGRRAGVGLAMDPQTGEILAFLNFPTFDNSVFASASYSSERQKLLTDPDRPLFNRAVSGLYSPGSTIKPLVGLAALAEGIVSPDWSIFSPGYLDVANPYDPSRPSRFLDWRHQGEVDLAAALAQSSNVYFYAVGGGTPNLKGLGINRLREWWEKLGLGAVTGVDMPNEESGFLPSIEWKEKRSREPWRLGDTYNVAIGQGDLLTTPIEVLNYISAIANGGVLRRPVLNRDADHAIIADLRELYGDEIKEIQKGMRRTVTHSLGTAHTMSDLPFPVSGKTGSAQIQNNSAENAFFVGYAPADDPRIAVLVLVERAREGSLNAVPIAKDVLSWYYENRLSK